MLILVNCNFLYQNETNKQKKTLQNIETLDHILRITEVETGKISRTDRNQGC